MLALPEHWLHEFYFLLYFAKIHIRLLHFKRAENCSAGPKGRLETAARQFLYDCWRGHDKCCYENAGKENDMHKY